MNHEIGSNSGTSEEATPWDILMEPETPETPEPEPDPEPTPTPEPEPMPEPEPTPEPEPDPEPLLDEKDPAAFDDWGYIEPIQSETLDGGPSGIEQQQEDTSYEADMAKLQELTAKAEELKAQIDEMGDNVAPGYEGAYRGTLGAIEGLKSSMQVKAEQDPNYGPDATVQAEAAKLWNDGHFALGETDGSEAAQQDTAAIESVDASDEYDPDAAEKYGGANGEYTAGDINETSVEG